MARGLRKVVLIGGGAVLALVLTAVALVAVLLATAPGHNLVRRIALDQLAGVLNGTLAVERLSGALWKAADARGIALTDAAGDTVMRAERLQVGYAVPDLLRRRVILRGVTLVRPMLWLIQDSSGAWNAQQLVRPSTSPTTDRPGLLVELRDVSLREGTIVIRPWRPAAPVTWTLTGVSLELDRLRAAHPDSSGLEARLTHLALRLVDPALDVRGLAGVVRLDADSVRFTLERLTLPGTEANLSGMVRWSGERPELDVEVTAPRVSLADAAAFDRRVPANAQGRLDAHVRWLASGIQEYEVRRLDLRQGRSVMRAVGRVTRSPRGNLTARGLVLDLEPFDLATLAPFVDSLPVRGLVRGRIRADGALADLAVSTDVQFTDEAVQPALTSAARGNGRLAWTADSGFAIPGFDLTQSRFELASARRFLPELALTGHITVAGHVAFAGDSVSWAGVLRHEAAAGQSGFIGSGRLRLGDAPELAAEVIADSLRFEALRDLLPALPLRGAAAGRLRLDGPLDALGFTAHLTGPWGQVAGEGAVASGADALTLLGSGRFDSLDVQHHLPRAPRTRLAGTWLVGLTLPAGGRQPSGNAELVLEPGLVEGVRVSGHAGIAFLPGRLMLDSSLIALPGGDLRAAGALGLPAEPPGQITWQLRLDTLAALEPLMRYALRSAGDTGATRLEGAADARGRMIGMLDAWEAEGQYRLVRIEAMGALLRGAEGRFTVARDSAATTVMAILRADSVGVGGLRYAGVTAGVSGRPDSLRLTAAAGFAQSSALRADAVYQARAAASVLRLERLEFDLPVGAWVLAQPAQITLTADTIGLDTIRILSRHGAGRLLAWGAVPRAAAGDVALDADSIPLADLYALLGRDTTGIGGALDLAGRLTGPAADPVMELQLFINDGRFGTTRAPAIQVLATYGDQRVNLKGGLWRDAQRVVNLSGTLPLDLALTTVERRKLDGPLLVTARADSVDLAILRAVTDAVRTPAGFLNLDVRVAGDWDRPRLSGHADLLDAAFTLPAMGVRYRALGARLELADTTVRVTRATMRSGEGTMTITGAVHFPALDRPVTDLVATLERFHAFEIRDLGGMTGSGEVRLRGPFIGDTLSGSLTVDQGFLRFADLVEKRVVNLDDPEFRAIVDSTLARAQDLEPGLSTIFLDSLRIRSFAVTMGPDVWLRSSEANIQLAGEFQVSKAIEYGLPRYRMDGAMRAVRGNYRLAFGTGSTSLLTREFRVTRGTVRFYGTPNFDPEMDIAAEHVVRRADGSGNITVRAIIGGTLLTPRLRLESDERPPLSEMELVSFMLTGRPLSVLTQRGGFDPVRDGATMIMGELSQALVGGIGLPLDVLTIRPGQSQRTDVGVGLLEDALAGATIEAGVQIGSRTYVSLNAGLCEVRTAQALGVSVEYRLSDQFTSQASLEPIVRACRAGGGVLDNTSQNYQFGFDLFWFLGGIR